MKIKMPQFWVEQNAGSFGSENMPILSGRKICPQFGVGKKMAAMSDQNKISANSGRKKMPASLDRKKIQVFWAIAEEVTGLIMV